MCNTSHKGGASPRYASHAVDPQQVRWGAAVTTEAFAQRCIDRQELFVWSIPQSPIVTEAAFGPRRTGRRFTFRRNDVSERFSCKMALVLLFCAPVLLVAGCGDDKAEEYFESLEQEQQAAESEDKAKKESSQVASEISVADLAVDLDEDITGLIPPPKLVGTKTIEEDYPNGEPRVKRSVKLYSDDSVVNHGEYVEWHPSGKKFCEGKYQDGKRTGQWDFWFEDGRKAKTGSYENGRPEGEWTYWRPDGTKDREESYLDSQRHGRWVYYDDRGELKKQEEYEAGQKHGTWITWYPNGKKKTEGRFVNGERHGPQTAWYENGQQGRLTEFKNGKRHGKAVAWNESGETVAELVYENDTLVKRVKTPGQ